MSSLTRRQRRRAQEVFDSLLLHAALGTGPKKPGYLVNRLKKEDREALKSLTSKDIQDRIK